MSAFCKSHRQLLADSVNTRICQETETPIGGPCRRSRLSAKSKKRSYRPEQAVCTLAARAALEDVHRQALPMDEVASALRHLAHVHEHDFPDVAVYVLEAAAIHEAVVLQGVHVRLASVSGNGLKHAVDGRAVVGAQAQHDFAGSMGVDDRLMGERGPLRVGEQHHVDAVGDDHAGSGVVAELRVVDGADRFIEGLGLRQVSDGQVDEDFLGHWRLSRSVQRGNLQALASDVNSSSRSCMLDMRPSSCPGNHSFPVSERVGIDTSYPAAPVSANRVSSRSGRRLTMAATESRR